MFPPDEKFRKPLLKLKHSLCFDNNSNKSEDFASNFYLSSPVTSAAGSANMMVLLLLIHCSMLLRLFL